ncbi:MAG TPA: aldo/keto reductase family protein [Magnetospirillaceae bacterium]|jgi:aryl-alcohol dehydrogenase-like predicted oxidoreductase
MQYRQLGSSGIQVSEIAIGSWLTYGAGVERDQALACVKMALDRGVTLIDTANIYGHGAAETFLGEALAGVPRDSYVLATKLFFPMTATDRGLSRAQIEKQIAASLKRLRVDYVDVYQCHRYDPETPLEETMRALTDAVSQGKARFIGFSEWPADKIEAACKMAGVTKFVSSQPRYNMFWPNPEHDVFPACQKNGISQIVFSPLAQGVLTGKYKPGAPPPSDSRAASASMGGFLTPERRSPAMLEAVEKMRPLANQAGLTISQFALAWVLRHDNVASAIIGATRPAQVEENVKASGAKVDPGLFREAERILGPARAR